MGWRVGTSFHDMFRCIQSPQHPSLNHSNTRVRARPAIRASVLKPSLRDASTLAAVLRVTNNFHAGSTANKVPAHQTGNVGQNIELLHAFPAPWKRMTSGKRVGPCSCNCVYKSTGPGGM